MDFDDDLEDEWHDFRRSLERRNRSPSTVHVYRRAFESFWSWANDVDIVSPDRVDAKVLNRWVDYMMTEVARRNDRPVYALDPDTGERVAQTIAASTRQIRWRSVRPFFTWWAKENETANPFDRADAPGSERDVPIPIVPLDDLRRLLSTCDTKDFMDLRDAAIIRILFDTGARLGEIISMGEDDWDRRADIITLRGKTGTRVVPVSASTGEALSKYRKARKTHTKGHLAALWLGPKGKLGHSGIAQLLRRRCEAAGIDHVNPHRIRHTWAHTFRADGGSEGDLMYLAGWSSTAMAHRYGKSAANERALSAARSLALGDRL